MKFGSYFLFLALAFTPIFLGAERLWEQWRNEVLADQIELKGWCSREKAALMMNLIYETKPKICVEIGVFGGASFFPTAQALKYCGEGIVYGIDSWSLEECLKFQPRTQRADLTWTRFDFDELYRAVVEIRERRGLKPYSVILRLSSLNAHDRFVDGVIDVLHIDGNHSEEISQADVRNYLPKVKLGGYIWMDDMLLPSTQQARTILSESCQIVSVCDKGNCILFRKYR